MLQALQAISSLLQPFHPNEAAEELPQTTCKQMSKAVLQ